MKFELKIEGDALSLRISEVDDTPAMRGRVANMEMALMKLWSNHSAQAVQKKNDKLVFNFLRFGSDHKLYMAARKVLEGFAVVWSDGVHGEQKAQS